MPCHEFLLIMTKKEDFRRCCCWLCHFLRIMMVCLFVVGLQLLPAFLFRRSLFDGSMSDDDHLGRGKGVEEARASGAQFFVISSWRDDMEIIILRRGFFLRRADFRRRRWLFSSLLLRWKKINIASFEDKQQTYDGRRNSGRGRETRKKSFVVWIIRVWASWPSC